MEKKQISNLETAGVGCLVSVGLLVLGVLILPASGYFFFCVIRYIILAFPLSLVGAFIGKMITELRMGVWLGAMVLLILGFAWLFSSPNYYSCVLSD